MARRSSISTLPSDLRDQINEMLQSGDWTLDEITDHLKKAGHTRSRSALGRYKQRLDQVGTSMRRSREMAHALTAELGPGAADGKTGRLLVEILQSLTFEHLTARLDAGDDEDAEAASPMDLMRLARTIKELIQAQKADADRELKLMKEAAAKNVEALDEALDEAEKAGEPGLSAERVAQLRLNFLGVKPAEAKPA